jgi:hypothetical protein
MRRRRGERRLFWEAFTRSYPVKATALLLIVALVVVGCGKEAAISDALGQLNYDSLPEKAPRPTKPAEKLHVAASDLKELLAAQAKGDLTDKQAKHARDARAAITAELDALGRQFDADQIKLSKLHALDALARLAKIRARTAAVKRELDTALARVPANGDRAAETAAAATKALTALSPDKPQQPLSSKLAFGINNGTPRSVSLSAGITPAYGAPTTSETPSGLPRAPESEDLEETTETRVTPAIHDLAQQLGGDPVKIYGYVRNQIRYEPYYGIRKGADETLAQKAGSDADQAALLIALLRDSGVHARFVQGAAELPAATAANWLGVDTASGESLDAVPDILAAAGVPTTQIRANGELVRVRFDHIWAEGYVENDAYRGAGEGLGGKTWLPLDPSIKANEFKRPSVDFKQLLKPTVRDFATDFANQSQQVGQDGIIAPTPAQMNGDAQQLLESTKSTLREHGITDDTQIGDVVGYHQIRQRDDAYLPSTTPFRARSVAGEFRAVPASLAAKVTVAVSGSDPFSLPSFSDDEGSDDPGFNYTARTDELASKRVTLAYSPATEQDAEIVDAYHGLLNAPAYAASLIPVLRVDGAVVARGHRPVSTGYTQNFRIVYRSPGLASDVTENPVDVGSLSAITLDLGHAANSHWANRVNDLAALTETNTRENLMTDKRMGEMFSVAGSLYFLRNDIFNNVLAQGLGVHAQRQLSGGVVATSLSTSYVASFPVGVRFAGVDMDIDEDAQSVADSDEHRLDYIRRSGLASSMSEGQTFEYLSGHTAGSTARVLQRAAAAGDAIYQLDDSNFPRLKDSIDIPAEAKAEIEEALAVPGTKVIVPDGEVTIGTWTGTGYIVDRGSTADYRIFGGASGGILGTGFPDPFSPVQWEKWMNRPKDDQQLVACVATVMDGKAYGAFAVGSNLLSAEGGWALFVAIAQDFFGLTLVGGTLVGLGILFVAIAAIVWAYFVWALIEDVEMCLSIDSEVTDIRGGG